MNHMNAGGGGGGGIPQGMTPAMAQAMAANGVPPGMGLPTPAGHQSELNYIYSMVEELSKQLQEARQAKEEIMAELGRIRTRARAENLNNAEVIAGAADELNG